MDHPRHVSPIAARRAWGDLRVRFWWLCAIALSIVTIIIAANRIAANIREGDLIKNGKPVTATVLSMDGSTRIGWSQPRSDAHEVRLRVKMPDDQVLTLSGTTHPGLGNLKVGGEMDIKVDPNQPSRWTDRTEALSWAGDLIIPLSLLPIVLLLLAMALLRRTQVLRIWRHGQLVNGVVHDLRHSAIAPRSRLVRFTIPELADARIFTTLVPTRLGIPEEGDTIEVVAIPEAPHRNVMAKVYEG